jgi:hypothetical protein
MDALGPDLASGRFGVRPQKNIAASPKVRPYKNQAAMRLFEML